MEKLCLDCGEKILGRSDKKFCNDICRNNYNNKQKRQTTNYMRNVNNILKKNWQVLSDFNPNGKAKIHKKRLAKAGFNFEYFTNIYTTKAGAVYYFVYEQGYLPIDNDYYALVVNKEYQE